MHLGICGYPTHYNVDVRVQWHSQNIAQHEVTLYKNRKYWVFDQNFTFQTIFFTFLRTQMHLGRPGKPTHYNVYVQVHWHCQNIAQNKVIWYKNRKYCVSEQNFHILNYIFTFYRTHVQPDTLRVFIHMWSTHRAIFCQNLKKSILIDAELKVEQLIYNALLSKLNS